VKIAIIGAHGTGKTTLSYQIAAYYKSIGKNVKIVQEVARSCPFPINEKMTIQSAKWIYLEHSRKELEAAKFPVVVCDRSVYDSFVYAEYFELSDPLMQKYKKTALQQMDEYDRIIFIRPDIFIADDKMRSVDKEFQESIDRIFEVAMVNKETIIIPSSKIFTEKNEWMSYCL